MILARPKTTLEEALEGHKVVARSCKKPRSFRRITLKAGTQFARAGEVFAFDKREIRLGRCEEVEITLENTDAVRHALMLPGLNPMFTLEFTGPKKRSARFVTPDEDITLEFHCHVETHEEMGMHGRLVIGKGGGALAKAEAPKKNLFVGVGVVIALKPEKDFLVIDHEEIKGFMDPMVMNYAVSPGSLMRGLKPKDKIRFVIDEKKRVIVEIKRLTFQGVGTVIALQPRRSQIVVDHEEIKGFMAAMIMGYPVKPARLLQGLKAGDRIRFTIDADQKAIVQIERGAP
ncbi:MAG: copper-binding protein [bacterium]